MRLLGQFFSRFFNPWGVICVPHGVPIWHTSALKEIWPFAGCGTLQCPRLPLLISPSQEAAADELGVSTVLFSSVIAMQSHGVHPVFIFPWLGHPSGLLLLSGCIFFAEVYFFIFIFLCFKDCLSLAHSVQRYDSTRWLTLWRLLDFIFIIFFLFFWP